MWPTDLLQEGKLSGWLAGAEQYQNEIFVYLVNNSEVGHGVGFKVFGYSYVQANTYGYDGPPAFELHVPSGFAGRGHGLTILSSGHIIVATSEVLADPDNGGESWFIVPPGLRGIVTPDQVRKIRCDELFAGTGGETVGARHAFQFSDGSIILGSNGWWKQFTLGQLLSTNVDYSTLPLWSYNGNGAISGIGHYDVIPVPGSRKLVVGGHDRFWQIDLGLPPGVIDGTDVPGGDGLDWIALGNNIGRPAVEDWGGAIARDAAGNYCKQQGTEERIAFWSAAQISSLPKLGGTSAANLVPFKTLTANLITALDENVHGLYLGLDFDAAGGLWNLTEIWDPPSSPNDRAMLMRFSPAAAALGGVQVPDRLIYMPALERCLTMRLAPAFRLQPR